MVFPVIIPPRSGTESSILPIFNCGEQNAGDATGSQSSIVLNFNAAATVPLVTMPQVVLSGISTIDNHDSNEVTSTSQIVGFSSDIVTPYIVNNTGGAQGTLSSGDVVSDEDVEFLNYFLGE